MLQFLFLIGIISALFMVCGNFPGLIIPAFIIIFSLAVTVNS